MSTKITDIVVDITHAPADIDTDRLSGQLGTWLSRYLGGSVAILLDFVGMVNSGMQIMHSNRLTFPGRPRAAAPRARTASRA